MSQSRLNFDLDPASLQTLCEAATKSLLGSLDAIGRISEADARYENTAKAIEAATNQFSLSTTCATFLKYVSPHAAVRAAADKAETEISRLFVDIFAREDLFCAIKAAAKKREPLAPEDQKLLDEFLILFRRNGLELPSEKRREFIEKRKRLVEIESEFANNLLKENLIFLVTRAELEGLPEAFISSLAKNEEGKYRLTTAYPHYFTFMDNAKSADARRRYHSVFNSRGGDKNRKLLEEATVLRDELSHLLGYPNHAAFVLERRMAKEPSLVERFLKDLAAQLKKKGEADLKELLELKRRDVGAAANRIESWDRRYYENELRKTKYNVDPQKIKEYFPLESVLAGMFSVYETLFGVKFRKLEGAPTWHSSVVKFAIERSGKPVAFFFTDLFPREGKYNHAAAFTLVGGFQHEDGTYEPPVSSIVANFNPPSGGKPSLLEHSEVETLFHEFGHIMHQTLTRAKHPTFSGTSVKTDFVEAPSQMLENWVWSKEMLQKISGHHQDPSKKLPEETIERMIRAKLLASGLHYLRQVGLALLDLEYHLKPAADTTAVYERICREVMLVPMQEGTQPQSSFGHLMGGYDAGYYGYLWSEVFAQDLFTRFEKEGLLNPKTGKDYVDWILEPGGEKEPQDLLKGFLHREPNNVAFLKSIGLSL